MHEIIIDNGATQEARSKETYRTLSWMLEMLI
jgi:hypothetical protein